MPLRPRYPYDVSKAAADLIARSYWHTYGLPVAVTRFANLYGGGDLNRSRLIPEAVARGARRAARPVIRSDGSPERDFLYVEDAVDAYLAIADALDGAARPGRGVQRRRRRAARACATSSRRLRGRRAPTSSPTSAATGTPAGEIDRQYVDAVEAARR